MSGQVSVRDSRSSTIALALAIGDADLKVHWATSPREWREGLLGQSLAGADGMLFTFTADVRYAFHMAGMHTPVLLSFFAADGAFQDLAFRSVGASSYAPDRPYRHALELVGRHASIDGALDLLPGLLAGIVTPP
jgi:uncharacterized membrane protein (UPF0127 family)